jgi:hypothetical protein
MTRGRIGQLVRLKVTEARAIDTPCGTMAFRRWLSSSVQGPVLRFTLSSGILPADRLEDQQADRKAVEGKYSFDPNAPEPDLEKWRDSDTHLDDAPLDPE